MLVVCSEGSDGVYIVMDFSLKLTYLSVDAISFYDGDCGSNGVFS